MPIGSIISQPSADSLNAAYRPIVFVVSATATGGGAAPVVYCDVYVNDVYYKSLQKTQVSDSGWQFDIQDACQEVLKHYIAPNGGSSIVPANSLFATVSCKFRSSGYDSDGFITAEDTAPVQGTGSTAPTAGTGTASNSFYVINSTLQHDQNQNLASHLAAYKSGTWNASAWPLSHRPAGYRVSENDSDYFPIIYTGGGTLQCIQVNYTLNDGTSGSENDCGVGAPECPLVNTNFDVVDNGNGTITLTITWINDGALSTIDFQYRIDGDTGVFTSSLGSATSPRVITLPINNYEFRLRTSGPACDSATSSTFVVGVDPPECVPVDTADLSPTLDDAHVGSAYDFIIVVTGSTPITKSAITKPAWMTISEGPSTHLTGTPGTGDEGTGIPVIFTLTNDCGEITINTTIDVLGGVHFGDTTFVSGDALNEVEIANLEDGMADATVRITLDTLTNTNGGSVRVQGGTAFEGNSWFVLLDGSGVGSLDVEINGNDVPGTTVIIAHFTITNVTDGVIGTPDTYQISKIFT